MKKFIVTATLLLTLAGCSASAEAAGLQTETVSATRTASNAAKDSYYSLHSLVTRLEIKGKIDRNTTEIHSVVNKVKGRVGKTWYVFSGATPQGWDCSGLVMWAYEQLGVELHHSAASQKNAGTLVKTPKFGDIVAFTYKGGHSAYHVGIYLGPDTMIHAGGGSGEKTSITSISKFAGSYSKVTYTRILTTN